VKRSIVLGLVLVSCVTVGKTVLQDFSATPVPRDQVHVFLQSDTIPTACTRVAILNAEGNTSFTNESAMLNKMREEAGKLGANALHMAGTEEPGGAERVMTALAGGSGGTRRGESVAYRCDPDVLPSFGTVPVDTVGMKDSNQSVPKDTI